MSEQEVIETTGTVATGSNGELAVVGGENQSMVKQQPGKMTWNHRVALGNELARSGFLTKGIDSGIKAAAVMLKGEELGIPRMQALSMIHIIEGKPACSAELMLALVKRDYGSRAIRVSETTPEKCTVQYREPGWDGIASYTWTIQDAEKAGLLKKNGNTWGNYPAAMLRARCISAVVRMAFPLSIAGMYTPEELGAEVTVNAKGEVILDSTWRDSGAPQQERPRVTVHPLEEDETDVAMPEAAPGSAQPIDEREAWGIQIAEVFASGEKDASVAMIDVATESDDEWRWTMMLEAAPKEAYAKRLKRLAIDAGVDPEVVDGALAKNPNYSPQPPAQATAQTELIPTSDPDRFTA